MFDTVGDLAQSVNHKIWDRTQYVRLLLVINRYIVKLLISFNCHLQLIHPQTGMFAKQQPAISLSGWSESRSLAVQEYRLVSHQCGEHFPFPILPAIPDEVSFAEVPSAHQTSKEPFHESLLLVLVKHGFTVGVDYGCFGFGLE